MQITTKLDKAKIQRQLDHVLSNALIHITENLAQYKLNENLPQVEEYQSVHDWFSFDDEKLGKALEEKVYSLIKYMPQGPFKRNDPFGYYFPDPRSLMQPMPAMPPFPSMQPIMQPMPPFPSMQPIMQPMPPETKPETSS